MIFSETQKVGTLKAFNTLDATVLILPRTAFFAYFVQFGRCKSNGFTIALKQHNRPAKNRMPLTAGNPLTRQNDSVTCENAKAMLSRSYNAPLPVRITRIVLNRIFRSFQKQQFCRYIRSSDTFLRKPSMLLS